MVQVFAVGRDDVAPLDMPERFRTDIAYFMTPGGEHGVPVLPRGEYWVRTADAQQWLTDGVVAVVSPLDSTKQAEFELSEDHEIFLEWLLAQGVEHLRLQV